MKSSPPSLCLHTGRVVRSGCASDCVSFAAKLWCIVYRHELIKYEVVAAVALPPGRVARSGCASDCVTIAAKLWCIVYRHELIKYQVVAAVAVSPHWESRPLWLRL